MDHFCTLPLLSTKLLLSGGPGGRLSGKHCPWSLGNFSGRISGWGLEPNRASLSSEKFFVPCFVFSNWVIFFSMELRTWSLRSLGYMHHCTLLLLCVATCRYVWLLVRIKYNILKSCFFMHYVSSTPCARVIMDALHTRLVKWTRKPSCRWQTRATLAKSLHGLRN